MSARGDAAFEDFARAQQRRLRGVAYDLTRDWDVADDLLQATFVKVYVNWKRILRREHPYTYARTVLFRTFIDDARRLAKQREAEVAPLPVYAKDETASVGEDDAVVRLLLRLPPKQRAVIYLRFVEDMTVEDTARLLNCTAGTIKSQTHDALRVLRTLALPSPNEGTRCANP